MVLAAGLGTRMKPLTDDRPKALVTVNGRALIDHVLDRLVAAGVKRAVVNVHAFADLLEAHVKRRTDIEIVISDERAQLMETGGGIKQALPLLGDSPFVVCNIDSVWEEPAGSAIARLARDYDPARAKALLDEAGYRDPDGSGPRPRLSLSYKTTSLEFPRLQAAVIQQNLRDVGIELDVRSYEFATLYADILKGNFQMYGLQWVGGALADPDILRRVFHSQQEPPAGFNRGHFSDPEVDRLIDRASNATEYEERRELYGKVQQRIAEAAPYISLWHRTNFALSQPSLKGIHLSPQGDFTFLRNVSR